MTINDFIKNTKEGRKLIPENGDVGNTTLKDINKALEKSELKELKFFKNNGERVLDNITLISLDSINKNETINKNKQNKKLNEEEM